MIFVSVFVSPSPFVGLSFVETSKHSTEQKPFLNYPRNINIKISSQINFVQVLVALNLREAYANNFNFVATIWHVG